MGNGLTLEYNEDSKTWGIKKEPYAVVECMTKEDYDELQKAWEFYKKHKADGDLNEE